MRLGVALGVPRVSKCIPPSGIAMEVITGSGMDCVFSIFMPVSPSTSSRPPWIPVWVVSLVRRCDFYVLLFLLFLFLASSAVVAAAGLGGYGVGASGTFIVVGGGDGSEGFAICVWGCLCDPAGLVFFFFFTAPTGDVGWH